MNWLKNILGRKKKEEPGIDGLLEKQTGDPAFLHKTNWIAAFGKQNYPLALTELDKALQIVPNSAHYLALRGMTKWTMQDRKGAYDDFSAARRINPAQREVIDLQNILTSNARECREKARGLAKDKRFIAAIGLLENALELEPDNAENHYFLGMMRFNSGDVSAAIDDITHTLQLDPQHAGARDVLQPMKNVAARQ